MLYQHFNKHFIDKNHTDNNFGSLYNVLCSQTVSACSCVLTELAQASQARAAGVEARRVRRDCGAAARHGDPSEPGAHRTRGQPHAMRPRLSHRLPRYRCRALSARILLPCYETN